MNLISMPMPLIHILMIMIPSNKCKVEYQYRLRPKKATRNTCHYKILIHLITWNMQDNQLH